MTENILSVEDLEVTYGHKRQGPGLRALRGVSLTVAPGETVAIVGESGTGKSTLGGAILGLVPVASGQIRFEGADITRVSHHRRRELSQQIQAVFQNPYGSFNPSRRIRDAIVEPLIARGHVNHRTLDNAVAEMLNKVGLNPDVGHCYPKQLSGGQLQRAAIARALIAKPRLVVLDEALSSLDLSVQAQIVNLLISLRDEFGLSYLFIGHDLDVVKYLADRVLVLYRGNIVEQGPAVDVCERPQHPYTRDLVAAVPIPEPRLQRQRRAERGLRVEPLMSSTPAQGCTFAPRCAHRIEVCETEAPVAVKVSDEASVMCHRHGDLALADIPDRRVATAQFDHGGDEPPIADTGAEPGTVPAGRVGSADRY